MTTYTISKTDGSTLVAVEQETNNTSATSLTLFGKLVSSYGDALNENFVHLLENFAHDTAPSNPLEGQIWWDTDDEVLKVYNGASFVGLEAATLGGFTALDFLVTDDNLASIDSTEARDNLDVYSRGESDTRYINTAGDTMTGTLTLAGAPASDLHAATKAYVDAGHWYEVADSDPTPSTYFVNGLSGFNAVNSPDQPSTNRAGWAMVTNNGGRGVQMSIGWDTDANSNLIPSVEVRAKDSSVVGQWSDWQKLAWDTEKLSLAGGTMTGALVLSGAPTLNLHAATKAYVDLHLAKAGGTMTGALLLHTASPSVALEAIPYTYAETSYLKKAGGTMTGALTLSGAPSSNLHAATKLYVDAEITDALGSGFVSKTGDTMSGLLTLSGEPSSDSHAATKLYADGKLALAGGTMTGFIILHDAPTDNMHAAPKIYVDQSIDDVVTDFLLLAGGTMTGTLVLASDPVNDLEAATKQYVDDQVISGIAVAVASGLYGNVEDKTADYTILEDDNGTLFRVDTTTDNITISLPEISTITDGFKIAIAKMTSDINTVIIDAFGTDTLNGSATYTLTSQWAVATVVADFETEQWFVVGDGVAANNITVENFSGNASDVVFVLSGSPENENNTTVYISGVYQFKNSYSISGNEITFSTAPPTGTDNIEVVWGLPYIVGVQQDDEPLSAIPNDHNANGTKVALVAGETLVFGDLCYIASDGKCWKADASAASTMPGILLCVASISEDATGNFLALGIARDDSWNWTVGGILYASITAGALTQTAPTDTGEIVQVLGVATHADRIFFNPSFDTVELA